MNKRALLVGVFLSAVGLAAISCSATANNHFGVGGQPTTTTGSATQSTGTTGMGGGLFGVGGAGAGGSPAVCTGLQCVAISDACAAKGKPPTTISGTVYDPAGALPLYNVYVYVPNSKPDVILTGNPTCTQCEAPASGSPVIGASSDASGNFKLAQAAGDTWGVPSGDNLPLVLQVGKWRRQLVMPHINACADNPLPDPTTPADKLRLPAKGSEGDMPFIAFTSGCDPAECFLRHIGIADSEFVPPGSGAGHVHFYTGMDTFGDASSVAGGNTSMDTYQWWTSEANLAKYDIVFNACECNPNDRNMYATGGQDAYKAMHDYLNAGGRVFTTHYYYNWFAPPTGPTDFQSVVNWALPEGAEAPYNNYYIDSTFPKGKAFADWLQANGTTTTYGQIALADTRYDMNTTTAESTRWIYNADTPSTAYAAMYMSFNSPVGVPATMQCGRAVYSDVHLSGTSDDSTFPNECADADFDGSHVVNEKALEFLFFDLSSCVQDNSQPPPPPPPTK